MTPVSVTATRLGRANYHVDCGAEISIYFVVKRKNGHMIYENSINEHIEMYEAMKQDQTLAENINEIASLITYSLLNGGRLLLAGNGGSASDAQHIAAEFVGRFQKERKAYDAESLSINTSSLTSIANDYSFKQIYSRQIEAKGRPGDIFIGISTSGKSPNVIEAIEKAKELKLSTIMLMGDFDNPILDVICDYVIRVPSTRTVRIQEAHIFIGHILAELVEESLSGEH